MKKKIAIYMMFSVVYTLMVIILTSSAIQGIELIVRFFINLIASVGVLFIANMTLNYAKSASTKSCFIHALTLATVACVIALIIAGSPGIGNEAGATIISETQEIESLEEQSENQDISIETTFSEQNTASRITQIIFDTLIAFGGGVVGAKLYKRRN